MAQSGFTPIQIYSSSTASNVPLAANLTNSTQGAELAINIADGKLYYKDSGGVVQTLATKSATSGVFTSVTDSGLTSTQLVFAGTGGLLSGTSSLTWDGTKLTVAGNTVFNSTGAVVLPNGTTGQQPTGVAGMLRFNSTTTQFEGYNGTTWSSVGGAAISNDTATASNLYPLFANATSGTALTVYTSNAKYLYKPSTGDLQAPQLLANNGLVLNATTLVSSYTIPSGINASSIGPFTVPSGLSVTVPSGQRWVVL